MLASTHLAPASDPPGDPVSSVGGGDQAAPQPVRSPAPGDVVRVVCEGRGTTIKEARDQALCDAVQQVAGTVVVRREEVRGDDAVRDSVLTYSDGFIESAEMLGEPTRVDGLCVMRLRCAVRVGAVKTALADAGLERVLMDMPTAIARLRRLDEAAQQAAAMAAGLFEDFPAKLLQLKVLDATPRPVERSKDGKTCIVEIRVLVSVSAGRWAAWMTEVSRVLGPTCEDSGEEAWSLRQKGYIPLDGSMPRDPLSGAFSEVARTSEFLSIPLLKEIVPHADRGDAELYITDRLGNWLGRPLREPACFAQPRVIAIHDPSLDRLKWWRLNPRAWAAACEAFRGPPRIRIEMRDAFDKPLGEAVRDWWPDSTGRPILRQRMGWPELRVQIGEEPNVRFSAAWRMTPRTGREGRNRLIVPVADLELTCPVGSGIAFAPVTVFPFRFRLPVDEAEQMAHNPVIKAGWVKP